MAQLRNPHPGEILKEEFLNPIGMSQNQLAHAIGVPGNRIHAIVNGTRAIIPICVSASSSACRKAISCGYRMPMTLWKPSVASPRSWPRSSRTSRARQRKTMKAIIRARVSTNRVMNPRWTHRGFGGETFCSAASRDLAQSFRRTRRNLTPGWSPFVNSTPARIRTFFDCR
jgi:hypothetical protein